MRKLQLLIKRVFDFTASLIALIVLSPILLAFAIIIKLTSKGPVFFKQERLGRNGKTFKIIKFRTMILNAEHIGEGLRVSSEKDPRITAIGRVLRATSADELPNLINVLIGDMSLVGPRPPVTYHPYKGYENYPEWAKKRFEMRPGVTGLAQATVRNSASWDDRIVIDNKYIKEFSILMDIKVLFWTVKRVVRSDDIYGVPGNAEQKEQQQEKETIGK